MTVRPQYTAVARREGGWWTLEVLGVANAVTQARRLEQAEDAVRDMLAALLNVPSESFDVAIQPEFPAGSQAQLHLEEAREARAAADRAQEWAREATGRAVRSLRGEGLPVRDIGTLIGVSYQHIARLLTPGENADERLKERRQDEVELAERRAGLITGETDRARDPIAWALAHDRIDADTGVPLPPGKPMVPIPGLEDDSGARGAQLHRR
jgi:hypothetical protein